MKKLTSTVSATLHKAVTVALFAVVPMLSLDVLALDVKPSSAKPLQPAAQKPDPRRLPGLSQSFIKDFQEVSETLEPTEEALAEGAKPNPQRAKQLADELSKDMEELNPYEKVMLYQLYGQIYFEEENIPKTIETFENILKQSPNLPVGMEAQYTYILAQLYAQEEQEKKAVQFLERWAKMTTLISSNQYSQIAQVYYGADDNEKALANMLEAIRLNEAEGKIPKEDWLGFLRALYFFKEDYNSTLSVVQALVRHYPKMNYWGQMASLYYELGRLEDYYRTLDSMYVMGGLKKENELKSLAGHFIENEAPYKAAKVLDKGVNEDKIVKPTAQNLELLANSWRLAQETDKALVEMKRAAAKSEDGDLYFNLARLLFARDEYDAAVTAASNALQKGGLSRPDSVHLTIGQAELARGNFDEAIDAFKKASRDKRSQKFASQWISYTENEKKRQDALKDG
ncbi:tetratricopeptide repeat protein [Gilvimarinus algae]|uniref:Tetratricopeptide repeat protein n=1 Tax=Gilvimarinus algae TaxID=3058037 RepID=A0ABT8TCA8_9GAMM|nr:tetratricopeptide repeat protein [Gilvimarinus sp. SDUM040014]MDO3381008.1 tetratricopeptide repeat protein [Gilvimarinus sp. SDUM040014]